MREKLAEIIFAWLSKPEEERLVYELIDELGKAIFGVDGDDKE